MVCISKSALNLMIASWTYCVFFSLAAFKIFSSSLIFSNLTDVPKCGFLCIYPTWGLLNFLNMYIEFLLSSFKEIIGNDLIKMAPDLFYNLLSFGVSNYTYVRWLDSVLYVSHTLFCWVLVFSLYFRFYFTKHFFWLIQLL